MYTECPDGLFGFSCIHNCTCKDKTEICNKKTGVCEISGCASPGVTIESGCLEGDNFNISYLSDHYMIYIFCLYLYEQKYTKI